MTEDLRGQMARIGQAGPQIFTMSLCRADVAPRPKIARPMIPKICPWSVSAWLTTPAEGSRTGVTRLWDNVVFFWNIVQKGE
jgi:hypothetical protein